MSDTEMAHPQPDLAYLLYKDTCEKAIGSYASLINGVLSVQRFIEKTNRCLHM